MREGEGRERREEIGGGVEVWSGDYPLREWLLTV